MRCRRGETAQPYTKEQAQKILDSGIFTYTLDEYDYSMAWDIYGLESAACPRISWWTAPCGTPPGRTASSWPC